MKKAGTGRSRPMPAPSAMNSTARRATSGQSTTSAATGGTGGDHVARGGAIAVIHTVGVDATERVGDWASALDATLESAEPEGLVQHADGVSGVLQFLVDGNDNAAQANDDTQDADRQNENELGGDDHTSFVIPEILEHVRDLFVFESANA